MGLSIEQMREIVARAYPGNGWRTRVLYFMPERQVIALYYKFSENGLASKPKKSKKNVDDGVQMTIWDLGIDL